MKVDLHHGIDALRAISPTTVTDNTPFVSEIIDTVNAGAVEFLISVGTLSDADATFTTLLEDGDAADLTDAAAVPDAYLEGTAAEASFDFSADNTVKKLGYIGPKRYLRLTITPTNNSASASVSAVAILGANRRR